MPEAGPASSVGEDCTYALLPPEFVLFVLRALAVGVVLVVWLDPPQPTSTDAVRTQSPRAVVRGA